MNIDDELDRLDEAIERVCDMAAEYYAEGVHRTSHLFAAVHTLRRISSEIKEKTYEGFKED